MLSGSSFYVSAMYGGHYYVIMLNLTCHNIGPPPPPLDSAMIGDFMNNSYDMENI